MNQILLFSRPIRSGKTTELMDSLPNMGAVGGILCPDKEGLRFIYSITSKRYYPLQSAASVHGETLAIGRFHFFIDGFNLAQRILLNEAAQRFDWLLVDEVGKLEMRDKKGLEPVLSKLIKGYKEGIYRGNLLLVVRDFLVDDVKAFYGLADAPVINDLKAWIKK